MLPCQLTGRYFVFGVPPRSLSRAMADSRDYPCLLFANFTENGILIGHLISITVGYLDWMTASMGRI